MRMSAVMAAVAIELRLSDDVVPEPVDGVGELLPEEPAAGDCEVMSRLGMLVCVEDYVGGGGGGD